jgi:hypothetical protein
MMIAPAHCKKGPGLSFNILSGLGPHAQLTHVGVYLHPITLLSLNAGPTSLNAWAYVKGGVILVIHVVMNSVARPPDPSDESPPSLVSSPKSNPPARNCAIAVLVTSVVVWHSV